MEASSLRGPPQDKTFSRLIPHLLLTLALSLPWVTGNGNPHQPYQLTWQVTNFETHEVLNETSHVAPLNTWFPDLYFNLDQIARIDEMEGGEWRKRARRVSLSRNGFYACPGFRTGPMKKTCGEITSLFCASWSCVTTNDGESKWQTQPWYVTMTYVRPCTRTRYSATCNLIRIKFEEAAKTDSRWTSGLIWGLNLYQTPAFGSPIQIKLIVNPASVPVPIGPNQVLTGKAPPSPRSRRKVPTVAPPTSSSSALPGTTPLPPDPETSNRLFNLIRGAYFALNQTRPESTASCWLCLATGPPYYEGIASVSNFTNSTNHSGCAWEQHKKLTLSEVSGSGTCIGKVPPSHQHLCNVTLTVPSTSHYLIPSGTDWWACDTGLTPCISTAVFNNSKNYCVLVQVVPRVYYRTGESFELQFEQKYFTRMKREPVSLTLAVMLGLGVAAGVGTGTAALVRGSYHLQQLRTAIDEDLRAIEHSITKLEESLTSLSEVVLQNRRGLDIVFLKEGGLCAALKGQCCFYADHSGVVKDSTAKLRKRLDERKKERESQQSWFEAWYNHSPWFSTLISTILGPLILLMLILTFGPCILNRLLTLIKDRLNIVHAMVLTQQYQALKTDEETQD
ncbi:MLV-related proviral Env polyprotein isoform X1 [Gorilla gorilla gorilla]|uniref:MLV-related proviral Env polyprotein isoform X1 n=1 Tax=Gorilla gorilla gorilla TaxID=9595 RepID=UPI00123ECEDA|nr:MLV-related proviral Env polyprotein isoform X1 [Gorilla gorilla gorilla]XP_030857538.1 MLV-related proviral Env polyprotein isoform X1 [Gorilla gorilla gorilla]XP_055218368.1 MLV-related proviral Env polyprotein isoform X1 [Gorilla gorilla gorilla]XP_055218369.1 MLV-related proviral Env polyprotein isoform X1 [Gorilla gorilla gorilla]XP_055218370.1 MLV-related proviral Env polyprotein isoform X1 [Gorilla gorilla gorilla]XP_055218371.1 MLV-related proviral Env polyprotein isoform X1 [Gorill